jgi:hypothetical protein
VWRQRGKLFSSLKMLSFMEVPILLHGKAKNVANGKEFHVII